MVNYEVENKIPPSKAWNPVTFLCILSEESLSLMCAWKVFY